ncbi:MAG TPA: PAS domain S-box protein, partial [Candidatus Methylomirabilis sp.]|nr:PAS domain S-box protein [Candidatus Methylomirabilis sp.]
CAESDTRLSTGVPAGEFRLYKCKNNMWDVATPIMVGGNHMGNLFSGQFLFEDEPPDQDLFRAQASRYGFPEDDYLQALEGVPRMSRESLDTGMAFFMKLAHMLSQLSYSNLRLARSLAERDALMQSLRASEEQLRQQREWLRVTLTSIGDAVLTTDTAGRITFLNPVAERLTGWRQDDALGRPVQSVFRTVDERAHEPAEDIVARVLREGCTVLLTDHTALAARDGREWPIEDSAAPITDSTGEVSGVVVVFHDVTEKHRAQAALRESEDRLRLAVESAELGTWDFDPVSGRFNWSDRCKALFGLPADAPVDYATFLERLHPEDRQRTHDLVQQVLTPGGSGRFDAEYRVRWPEGTERWILAGGRAFFGSVNCQPRAVRFIGTVLDITARKQAEEALHQARSLLEQRVRERTSELSVANRALAHRSDQLRILAAELTLAEQRERKRLATVLHDEHQQLLVAAKIRVSLLERMTDPRVRDAGHEVATLLQEAIENARSLTRELSPPVSLTGGLAPAVDWLVRWMEQKYHLAVETQVDETAVPASDELTALLFQSMRELLFNIVKHTTVQTARVEIAREAGQLRLSVSDAGGGFYPPDLRVEGGTGGGFGLFSIRQRVELLGGRMDIDSGYGRGSRFTLWVPLRPELAEHPAGAPVPKRSAGKQGKRRGKDDEPALKKVRVLLADDHTMVRQALARMLSQEPDIEVVGEASDGKLAVEFTRQLRPDVVAMDVNMPVMDGIQATRAIHAEFPDMRVIGLSMLEEGEERSAMWEAGAVAHLSKSGPSEALTAAIRACVRGG